MKRKIPDILSVPLFPTDCDKPSQELNTQLQREIVEEAIGNFFLRASLFLYARLMTDWPSTTFLKCVVSKESKAKTVLWMAVCVWVWMCGCVCMCVREVLLLLMPTCSFHTNLCGIEVQYSFWNCGKMSNNQTKTVLFTHTHTLGREKLELKEVLMD